MKVEKYEAVTIKTLTDEQVRVLRREAQAHGDTEMTSVCDRALGSIASDADLKTIVDTINNARAQV